MALYDRLAGIEEPKLSVHTFMALAAEVSRSQATANAAATFAGLSASEKTEAQTLIARVTSAAISRVELHDVLLLLEVGFRTVAETKTRLGV